MKDWWPSPAKINLFLHILGRFDNGYHQLQTLFQILDISDQLAFEVTESPAIKLVTPIEGVSHDDNLIVKAAHLLQRQTNSSRGVRIALKKILPMGGGLGGGSSNAATTLVALNYLWELGLTTNELATLGLSLGADVPIFIHGQTAFAEGVGETIIPVSLPESWYGVVSPGVHVSTADVFQHPQLPRNTPAIDFANYTFDTTHNDCEEIVCERHPEVANLLQWLVHYAPSRMTGTGACVFAAFANQASAKAMVNDLPSGWTGFVAKGVNLSPLQQKLLDVNAARDKM